MSILTIANGDSFRLTGKLVVDRCYPAEDVIAGGDTLSAGLRDPQKPSAYVITIHRFCVVDKVFHFGDLTLLIRICVLSTP